jgi:hypothetical protein
VNANQFYTIQLAGKGEAVDRKQQAGREEEKHRVKRKATTDCFRKLYTLSHALAWPN